MLLQQQMPGRQGGRIEIAVGLDQFLGATVQRVDMNPRAARRADTDRQRDGFFWRSAASAPVGQPKELFAQPAQSVVRFARLGFRVKPFDLGAIGMLLRGPCGLFQLHAPHAGGCGHQADRRIAGTQVAIPSHRMWPEMQVGFPVVHGPCRWAETGRPKRHVHRELIPARVAHHVEGPGFKHGSDARRTMVADHHACPSWALLQYFGAAQSAVVAARKCGRRRQNLFSPSPGTHPVPFPGRNAVRRGSRLPDQLQHSFGGPFQDHGVVDVDGAVVFGQMDMRADFQVALAGIGSCGNSGSTTRQSQLSLRSAGSSVRQMKGSWEREATGCWLLVEVLIATDEHCVDAAFHSGRLKVSGRPCGHSNLTARHLIRRAGWSRCSLNSVRPTRKVEVQMRGRLV